MPFCHSFNQNRKRSLTFRALALRQRCFALSKMFHSDKGQTLETLDFAFQPFYISFYLVLISRNWTVWLLKPWSNESASLRKLICDDTSQTAAQVVVTSSPLSLYSLTFLRWYISHDSPLKRCLKDTFLLVYFRVWQFIFLLSIWPWPVWLCCFRYECCFDLKQHRLHPRPPCSILIQKTFIDLCFVFKQLASWKKLAIKFEQAQISRKLSKVGSTNEAQACTS